jgi:tRNA(adenine34) deaminase
MQVGGPKFPEQEREAHQRGMELALAAARRAEQHGDVPIGAALLRDGELLAAAGNERELRGDPTAHAEILTIRAAAEALGGWRLGSVLDVLAEPALNHRPRVIAGVRGAEAATLLREFFAARRRAG